MNEVKFSVFARIVSCLLLCCMLFSLAACGGNVPAETTSPADEVTDAPDVTEAATTVKQYVAPDLYYDSADFNILVTAPVANGVNPFAYSDSQLVLDNAVYMRNTAVEEELGVNINVIYEYGDGIGAKRVAADAKTQDGAYDALLINSYDVASLAHQDYLVQRP